MFYFDLHIRITSISHDVDNILLENIGEMRTLQAVFELEALLLTGYV